MESIWMDVRDTRCSMASHSNSMSVPIILHTLLYVCISVARGLGKCLEGFGGLRGSPGQTKAWGLSPSRQTCKNRWKFSPVWIFPYGMAALLPFNNLYTYTEIGPNCAIVMIRPQGHRIRWKSQFEFFTIQYSRIAKMFLNNLEKKTRRS